VPGDPSVPAILDVSTDDLAEITGLLGRAFADNPGFRALLHRSDDARRLRETTRGMRWPVLAARRCGHIDGIRLDGRLVAVAIRFAPGQYPLPLVGAALMVGMGLCGGPRAIPRFYRIDQFMLRHHPRAPHHYLYFIGVEPAFQGRGLGSALLRHLGALADASGHPSYLETDSPDNVRLYERHGYRVDGEHVLAELSDLRMWLMTRPPQ